METQVRVYGREPWREMVEAKNSGQVIEINEEVFDYWLEVLPPVYMNLDQVAGGMWRRCSFGFAEGAELVTDFWTGEKGKRFFCQLSARMNRC